MESKQTEIFKEHLKSENQTVKPIGVFKKLKIGFVEVEHGLTDTGDFAWHFSSWHRARPFPSDPVLFLRIIQTYLGEVVASDVTVDIYLAPKSWEKQVISVLARGVGKKWNFDEDAFSRPIQKICDLMTEELNRLNPRRTVL